MLAPSVDRRKARRQCVGSDLSANREKHCIRQNNDNTSAFASDRLHHRTGLISGLNTERHYCDSQPCSGRLDILPLPHVRRVFFALKRTAILATGPTTSRASSSCFPGNPSRLVRIPVTFVPGRASLTTSPKPTGSLSEPTTIGVLVVDCLIASAAAVLLAMITSGLSRTNSSASSGRRVKSPSA